MSSEFLFQEARDNPNARNKVAPGISGSARQAVVKSQVLGELRDPIPARIPAKKERSRSTPRNVSKPDSRPASPSSPMSPASSKRQGLLAGFGMNLFVNALMRSVTEADARLKKEFLNRLRKSNNYVRSLHKLKNFFGKKRLNALFNGFVRIREYRPTLEDNSPIQLNRMPLILPLTYGGAQVVPPPLVAKYRYDVGLYAGLGKVVGVVYSIQRILKDVSLQKLLNA